MKVVAFVPIRLNSKRVAGKNTRLLGNKPLLWYILNTLLSVKKIDEVYVFCSDESIASMIPLGVKFLKRPLFLDRDETLGKDIYEEFTKTIDADIYILAHATSPFIKSETIDNALSKVIDEDYDSAFSTEKIQTFTWYKGKPLNYDLKEIPRTQTIEPVYVETSAFFIFKRDVWKIHKQRIGSKPFYAIVDKMEGIDIDWPEDFALAEIIQSRLT